MINWIKEKWSDYLYRRDYKRTWGTPVGSDCISLDISLAKWLADRLEFLSLHANGAPYNYGGTTDADAFDISYEKWTGDLLNHSTILRHYAAHRYDLDTWEQEKEIVEQAQATMHWIADNLPALWD